MSERARTYEEAIHLIEAYRLFVVPALFAVGLNTYELDSRGDPAWRSLDQFQLLDFCQAANGSTEIDIGDRYRIEEPFDMEFNHCGFVVWSAASVQVARPLIKHAAQTGPQLIAPLPGVTQYGSIDLAIEDEVRHGPFEEPTTDFSAAVNAGAPLIGLLEANQFPIVDHGWHPAEIDIRFPPVTLTVW